MKKIIFLVLIASIIFPFAKAFALTPNLVSTKATPGVTTVLFEGSVNPNGLITTAWFEYGTTESLSIFKETTHLAVGSSIYPTPFKANLAGLTPDTTYYFRIVADNGQSTAKGKVESFKTMKDENASLSNQDNSALGEVKGVSSDLFNIKTDKEELYLGEEVSFLITFKNETEENFENVKISVELPSGIEFTESNFGKAESANYIVFKVDTLIPGQVESMSVKGEIERGAENKDVLVTTAVMTYESGKDNKKNELIDYATNRVKENKETALAANSAYLESNKFLPNTLLDWLTLILVISGLVLVGKNLYKDLPSPKPEKVKVAKSLE